MIGRKFLGILLFSQLTFHVGYSQQNTSTMSNTNKTQFSIGVIADCQYCNEQGTGIRKYAKSEQKLEECVTHFNTMDLAYTIHLGDFIDKDWESFNVVTPIYNRLNMPKYHVLGNHDYSVEDDEKAEVYKKMDMPSPYYDFKVEDWRFIVLDGNDISLHAYPEDSEAHLNAANYYVENHADSPFWNGAIGPTQMQWLRDVLDKSLNNKEKVVLYCHFPVYPENIHNLWNADEVIETLESYPNVKAYINGHNHEGNYGEKNGIHYITMKGMVDTEENSYGVVKVSPELLEIIGYGRETSRIIKLQNSGQ
ncbi:metallophosphoesterase [Arenibacter latericius]|uniref:metallophosphoesterase n=1 Tax=Arenibacter latericius TaxID=86104 RepID=UPI0004051181|nr:metallophosphoesterase [Arenibacter latericius]MDX1364215.1 metallophosphoesterase [Arenibacter latericius]